MNTFEYTCLQNPRGAIDLAQTFSNTPVKDNKDAYNVFINIMQNEDEDTKKKLLSKMREIHPDSELYRDEKGNGFWTIERTTSDFLIPSDLAIPDRLSATQKITPGNQVLNPENKPMNFNACGCSSCSKSYNSVGNVADPNASYVNDVTALKTEEKTKKMIFNVVISIVLVAIIYKLFIKKD